MKLFKFMKSAAAGAVAALALAGTASAAPVGLELMLLVDVSGSVDSSEYSLQRDGYVQAFQSAAVQNAILNSQGGSIAVTYIEWSSSFQQSVRVGWSLINSVASANAFATALNGVTRAFAGATAVQSAINNTYNNGALGFGTEVGGISNGFESLRQVIDVSGDGVNNDGLGGTVGRDAALAAGVDTINGVVILGESGLQAYYENNVKGGASGFVSVANSFADFGAAIQNKLIAEISNPVPEPGSLALAGVALLAATATRRRLRKQ